MSTRELAGPCLLQANFLNLFQRGNELDSVWIPALLLSPVNTVMLLGRLIVSTLQIASYSDWRANYPKPGSGERRGKGMFVLPALSRSTGAKQKSMVFQPSPWAQQMTLYAHCGIQEHCPCGGMFVFVTSVSG